MEKNVFGSLQSLNFLYKKLNEYTFVYYGHQESWLR